MNSFTRFALAAGAAGVLVGCAQPMPMPMPPGMMMGQMPMMGDAASMSPEMKAMMTDCMRHMQAMSAPRDTKPSDSLSH